MYNNTTTVEAVQSELLEIFNDLHTYEENVKDKASAQRKLAARRAIEQHFERKKLESDINEFWD
ncbi:hypothetical protein OLMES_4796 [Oleiphilus messinensis]|uniref:Uncharacterized protein n=1 Tax=Oleiphilus messinensis TaxID=141451 RepID=A0A1Y0IGY7_9GAMM|nr:hypothetical protein [Oleiphilus messinensis]ARU58785.1 hypothetical protein OLMES_4796 [Oleiphilus messinensis]